MTKIYTIRTANDYLPNVAIIDENFMYGVSFIKVLNVHNEITLVNPTHIETIVEVSKEIYAKDFIKDLIRKVKALEREKNKINYEQIDWRG